MLYLAESEYPPEVAGDTRPTLPITAWVQYVLDNYATTAEAVEALRRQDFRMVTVAAPTGEPGTTCRSRTLRATPRSSSTSAASW